MKGGNYLLFTLVAFTSMSILALDTGKRSQKNMDISVDPASLLMGTIPVRFSFGVTDNIAVGVRAYGTFFGIGEQTVVGFGGALDAKFYLSGKTFEDGWYVKPSLQAGYRSVLGLKGPRIAAFAIAGYGWVWPSGFSLELGGGISYSHWFVENKNANWIFGVEGLSPTLDFSLGWAF